VYCANRGERAGAVIRNITLMEGLQRGSRTVKKRCRPPMRLVKRGTGDWIILTDQENTLAAVSQGHYHPAPAEILNLYHCTADNIGDRMCGPGQYLWPEVNRDLSLAPVREALGNVIIGGGQLFSQLSRTLYSIHELNPDAKVVAWGVGLPPAGTHDKLVQEVTQDFALFGTRNYDRREQLTFIPCASCLSPLFDHVEPPQNEIVFYLHRRKGESVETPQDAPVLTNSMRPHREVIDFIASGQTVVTSSYHGVYWAQLLGRRVICLPYNNKFETFQHRPVMAEAGNWRSGLALESQTPPSLLEEYRALNHAFARQTLELWNG
jgi:hypothetical protein